MLLRYIYKTQVAACKGGQQTPNKDQEWGWNQVLHVGTCPSGPVLRHLISHDLGHQRPCDFS